jgi:hypothetical protein
MTSVFAVFLLNRCAWCTHTHTHTLCIYIYIYIYTYIYVYILVYIPFSMCEVLEMDEIRKVFCMCHELRFWRCSVKMLFECRWTWWCSSHHSPWIFAIPSKGPITSVRVVCPRITRTVGDMTQFKWNTSCQWQLKWNTSCQWHRAQKAHKSKTRKVRRSRCFWFLAVCAHLHSDWTPGCPAPFTTTHSLFLLP